MLVRILHLCEFTDYGEYDYENTKFLGAYHEENFDKLINALISMKDRTIQLGDEWYTLEDFTLNLAKNKDELQCINVYVSDYAC